MRSFKELAYVSGIGLGLVGIGTVIANYVIEPDLRRSINYLQALAEVKKHPEIKKELGEPIVDLIDKDTVKKYKGKDELGIFIKVPLKGPNASGIMQYWVKEDGLRMRLSRVEFKFNHINNRKLLIKDEKL